MSRSSAFRALVLVLAVACLATLPARAAKDKTHPLDLVVQVPDYSAHRVQTIAMLPVATFDRNANGERMVAALWAQKLASTGYRWRSADLSREMITSALGDSTVTATRGQILKSVRVDSLSAPRLCSRLRVDALLSIRVDQWEQREVKPSQVSFLDVMSGSGQPSTSVSLKAALVDSSGALLWSISGSETVQGVQLRETGENTIGIKHTGLSETTLTDEGSPPSYMDVLNRIFERWTPLFPPVAAAKP